MRSFAICIVAIAGLLAGAAEARGGGKRTGPKGGSHHVAGHVTKDGKYVQPHQATNPNKSKRDNWSSKGNANPYTGKEGSKDPDKP